MKDAEVPEEGFVAITLDGCGRASDEDFKRAYDEPVRSEA